jgi:hypothetical protein
LKLCEGLRSPKAWLKRDLNQHLQQLMSTSYSGYGCSNQNPDAFTKGLYESNGEFEAILHRYDVAQKESKSRARNAIPTNILQSE